VRVGSQVAARIVRNKLARNKALRSREKMKAGSALSIIGRSTCSQPDSSALITSRSARQAALRLSQHQRRLDLEVRVSIFISGSWAVQLRRHDMHPAA